MSELDNTRGANQLSELLSSAAEWAAQDPDPATAAELRALVEAASSAETDGVDPEIRNHALAELQDAFAGTLQFGTAGLRAALGPGPNRMNRVVVRRAAAGLAAYLNQRAQAAQTEGVSEAYRPRAVVGFDARHNSDVFARESAAIFTAAGIETFLMPAPLPTPVLVFAVRALGCEAGVMVTASHNPPQDNGYKVYLGGKATDDAGRGAQIVPPADAEIAAQIQAASAPGVEIELATEGWTEVPAEMIAAYRQGLVELAQTGPFPARDISLVLTAMHGVGASTAEAVLRGAGFENLTQVAAQEQPDPAFPTVSFPNPEEPGALDLALQTAAQVQADLVLANDPDADRVAAAALDPATGAWRMLRGDEVGALLGWHIAQRLKAADAQSESPDAQVVFANSIVSSHLLASIARAEGFAHQQTLTGFKWISRVPGLNYGYEEALGYCVAPGLVRDKDGISAGLLIAELAADLKAKGQTLFGLLDQLAVEHGLHQTDQLSLRVSDLSLLGRMMSTLRNDPPQQLGGAAVVSSVDLAQGLENDHETLPPTDGLLYLTEDGSRVIVRPSGTEPKLKCYLEAIVPVPEAENTREAVAQARLTAQERLTGIRADLERIFAS